MGLRSCIFRFEGDPIKNVDVDIPLGVLEVVTGVAGAGKSALIHGSVSNRDGVISIDQTPIRGSRRSNPATLTGEHLAAFVGRTTRPRLTPA